MSEETRKAVVNERISHALLDNMAHNTMHTFMQLIAIMNRMYKLPVNRMPSKDMNLPEQLQNFKKILSDEIAEIDDIILNNEHASDIQAKMAAGNVDEIVLDAYVALADLLADIVVYCFSESLKHGIYLPAILHNVMLSNFSKLGENGQPIKDETGKFLKGPNYFPPEPAIRELLAVLWADAVAAEGSGNESTH